jgi:flagellar biosynthesis component FlhA
MTDLEEAREAFMSELQTLLEGLVDARIEWRDLVRIVEEWAVNNENQ